MGRNIRNIKCKIVGTSVQGRLHIKKSLPCQDKISHYNKKGVYCIALADGAGFSEYSQIGAKSVTKFLSRYIVRNFQKLILKNEETLKNILHKIILQVLQFKANEENIDIKFLASTLLCVAFDNKKILIFHIGDGVIGATNKNDEIIVSSLPNNEEFANVTYFTTSENFSKNLKLIKDDVNKYNGFILMSDGVSESLFDKKNKEFAPAVKNIFNWFEKFNQNEIKQALDYNIENVIKCKTFDDCSLIIGFVNNNLI